MNVKMMDLYKKHRRNRHMIKTPFGAIEIYIDDKKVDYVE